MEYTNEKKLSSGNKPVDSENEMAVPGAYEECDFERIIEDLAKEVDANFNLVKKVYHYSNNLKKIEIEQVNNDEISRKPDSIVSHLFAQIKMLHDINSQFYTAVCHLEKVIGG